MFSRLSPYAPRRNAEVPRQFQTGANSERVPGRANALCLPRCCLRGGGGGVNPVLECPLHMRVPVVRISISLAPGCTVPGPSDGSWIPRDDPELILMSTSRRWDMVHAACNSTACCQRVSKMPHSRGSRVEQQARFHEISACHSGSEICI